MQGKWCLPWQVLRWIPWRHLQSGTLLLHSLLYWWNYWRNFAMFRKLVFPLSLYVCYFRIVNLLYINIYICARACMCVWVCVLQLDLSICCLSLTVKNKLYFTYVLVQQVPPPKDPPLPVRTIQSLIPDIPPAIRDVCQMPLVVGNCRGRLLRWFFNAETEQCENFVFSGCRGNRNNFPSFETCQKTCLKVIPGMKTFVWIYYYPY